MRYTEFIDNAEGQPLWRRPCVRQGDARSIGIGALGYHSYLQKNRIPFESIQARPINKEMFDQIESQSIEMSWELGDLFGKTKHAGGKRHSTLQAVAPTSAARLSLVRYLSFYRTTSVQLLR